MKVKLGPYKNFIGPHQIAEFICFWAKKETDEYGLKRTPEWVDGFGLWLAGGEDRDSLLTKFCQWVDSKRKRNVTVKIDPYDTWNMHHSLALIILPMLKELKEDKAGSPYVDDKDVPIGLLKTTKDQNSGWADNNHQRWEWVLDEMIFAFEHILDEDNWKDEFCSGEFDNVMVPVDKAGNEVDEDDAEFYRMDHGPNHTYTCDYDSIKEIEKRIQRGCELFGKYFQALWT